MSVKSSLRVAICLIVALATMASAKLPPVVASTETQTAGAWRGEYYAEVDLVGAPVLVREDKDPAGTLGIDFDWGDRSPASGLPADGFSVRWTRALTFDAGLYRFRATVDDGVRLFLDGALAIDAWRDGTRRELTADRQLAAGKHTLRLEYYDRTGPAAIRLRWEKVVSPSYPDWRGEYWGNTDLSGQPALVRNDKGSGGTQGLDFDWGSSSPGSGLPADGFSARWTRTAAFTEGTYRFRVTVDDGIRVYVDGELLINEWREGGRRDVAVERKLAAGNHSLRVEYYERSGVASVKVQWENVGPSIGWRGEYWANLTLTGSPALVRPDADLAFDWGQGTPNRAIPNDGFSARWTRTLNLDAGTYRFHILVDDGMRLWVDGRLILDAWSDHDSGKITVDYAMAAGSHTIRVEYYERIGNARIWVWWEKVTDPSVADWKGEYWNNRNLTGEPAMVRTDRVLDFDWGNGSPSSILPVDNFSARWTRQRNYDGGTYRFHILADDGIRMWVDGQLIVDAWRDQQSASFTRDVVLTRGFHTLKVEYYEHAGGARVQVWTEKVTTPSYPDWKGEYWSNRNLSGNPALVRNDQTISFDWGGSAPATGLPKDSFSVRWSRQATFASGRYRFYAWADDGIRVRVDGSVLLNEWHASAGDQVYTADLSLDGTHSVTVEYYEQSGDARVRFWWSRIGDR